MTEEKKLGDKIRKFLDRKDLPVDAPKQKFKRKKPKAGAPKDRKHQARKLRRISAVSRKFNARRARGRKWKGR